MFYRLRRFLDQYGIALGALLFTLLCWFIIANNFHQTRALFILSPVNWVLVSPAGPGLMRVIEPFGAEPWWAIVETLITSAVWLILFYGIRGIFYSFTGMNAYYGIVILIGAVIIIAFIIWVVIPMFDEINSWWQNWPGRKPNYPGQ